MGNRLYTADKLLRQSVAKNVNDLMEEKLTIGHRVSDGFAAMDGGHGASSS